MKLVKIIKTNKVKLIQDVDFDINVMQDLSNSIYHWYNDGIDLTDYVYARDKIIDLVTTIGFTDVKYKDIVCDMGIAESSDCIPYYMGLGMTQQEATNKYILNVSTRYNKSGLCYSNRLLQPQVKATIITFLGVEQGLALSNAIIGFKDALKENGHLGTLYGTKADVDGVMDYFENTGSYTSTGGLASYQINPDVITLYGDEATALLALKEKLHNYIIEDFYNGNI